MNLKNSRFEKTTDLIVFSLLRANNYVDGSFNLINKSVKVWANKSSNSIIDGLLSKASKRATGKQGYPEYIIYDKSTETIIVIENKKDTKKHIKTPYTKYSEDYAVNGALWYAKFLSETFNVVAVGISGKSTEDLLIDSFFIKKGSDDIQDLELNELVTIEIYRKLTAPPEESLTEKAKSLELNSKSKEMNEFLRSNLGVGEHERLYVLGSILYALEDQAFIVSYEHLNQSNDLSTLLFQTVERKVKGSGVKEKDLIINELKPVLLGLGNSDKDANSEKYPNGTLLYFIKMVRAILFSLHSSNESDFLTPFFNVFLSYSTKGGSDLGIVLTPQHITSLFCDIAEINLNSKILDTCAGTGGFLAAAWRSILYHSSYTNKQKDDFRRNNLYGIENNRRMYTILALNMFLNKDGKTHLYFDDCFNRSEQIKKTECNVGFINPPYSDELYSEISFIELMLDSLLPNSIGVAITSVNSVSNRTKKHNDVLDTKRRVLQKHSLIASIQMPNNLFYPKGTETVILVFRTGEKNITDTWFAKFDDGYELIKHQKTRTPSHNSNKKYEDLITAYRGLEETEFSFLKTINPTDQWIYTLHHDFKYNISDLHLQEKTNDFVAFLYGDHYE